MAPPQHRFSRRFLTLLIFITCIAIALLSKLDDADNNQPESVGPQPLSQP